MMHQMQANFDLGSSGDKNTLFFIAKQGRFVRFLHRQRFRRRRRAGGNEVATTRRTRVISRSPRNAHV